MKPLIEKAYDIRLWIFVFFLIRLIGITHAPLEVSHNWRQTTVTMVARNFVEVDNNILYPRIDIAGDKSGITGMEFPVLNYLIYLLSLLFGYQHWYGRLINLVVSSVGLFYFFKLAKLLFTQKTAFYATIILMCSIWFSYSRKIMPDTFSVSFILAGMYYGYRYLYVDNKGNKSIHLLLYGVLITLGMLSKLPASFLLVCFIIPMLDKDLKVNRKLGFILISIIAVIPVIGWYFLWVPHLVETYGFWHFFMGKSFLQGSQEIVADLDNTLKKFYEEALKFVGFFAFVVGVGYSIKNKNRLLLQILVISFLAFAVIILKAGSTFPHHSYYIIPFVPVMALVAGYGLSSIKYTNLAMLFLLLIVLEGTLNQMHDFRIKDEAKALLRLEADMDKVSNRNDLILINSGQYPTPMYFAHRKGWVESNEQIQQTRYINELAAKGLKHVVIMKKVFGSEITLNHPVVMDNEDYRIYRIDKGQ